MKAFPKYPVNILRQMSYQFYPKYYFVEWTK